MSKEKEWWMNVTPKDPKFTKESLMKFLETFLEEVEDELPNWEELEEKLNNEKNTD